MGMLELDRPMESSMNATAVITGTSSGIGAAAAQVFLDSGWNVIGLSRRPCPVKAVQWLCVDFLKADWEAGLLPRIKKELPAKGRICLIHNAAMMHKDRAVDMDIMALRDTLELNVVTPCALNNILWPMMTPESSILYVGSTLSEKAVANTASYVASKHAIAGLMRATTQDLIGTGIHSAAICPGFTATEMLLTHVGDNPEVRAFLEGMSTFNRLIEPVEIAKSLLFCAENPVINGSLIHANLGQVER